MTELLDGIDTAELRGRRQRQMSAVAVRPLQEADLALLKSGERAVAPQNTLKRLRDRHHAIARLVAAGKSNTEISLMTGMDPGRISVFKSDPSFKQLVDDYKKIDDGIAADLVERMALLSQTAIEEIQDRIENADEPLPIQSLLEIAKFGTDRIGHGPVTKQMNTNVNLDLSGRLAAARKRAPALAPPEPEPVDAEFTEVSTGTDG